MNLWKRITSPADLSAADVRQTIYAFLDRTDGARDWDEFLSLKIKNPELERIRLIAIDLPDQFPPGVGGGYCAEEGLQLLRRLADELA